jgi:hypothetical protein
MKRNKWDSYLNPFSLRESTVPQPGSYARDAMAVNDEIHDSQWDHDLWADRYQSVDLRRQVSVASGVGKVLLLEFTPRTDAIFYQQAYAVFADTVNLFDVDFVPVVSGVRVFPYHGDPQNRFRINRQSSTQLNNLALVNAPLKVQPLKVYQWFAINNTGGDVDMSVRIVGFVQSVKMRDKPRMNG